MTLEEALEGVSSVLIDSAPAIYHLERHPRYAPLLDRFFHICDEREILIVTSPVTLAESLVRPVSQGLADLIASYRKLILEGEDTTFWAIRDGEAESAARIRADHGLPLPDAFQVAIARSAGCDAILTNDADFRRVPEPRVIILDDFVGDEER